MNSKRTPIRAETIQAVATEYIGQPISAARARSYLNHMEPIWEMFSSLRDLPLREVEPAIIFRPTTKNE
ncbi:MAG TPA: hypothetical protein DGR97_05760 [Gammaproteobacteria bacterium]|nr:hypothetical protein [Gammaproteobacteria bacterium]